MPPAQPPTRTQTLRNLIDHTATDNQISNRPDWLKPWVAIVVILAFWGGLAPGVAATVRAVSIMARWLDVDDLKIPSGSTPEPYTWMEILDMAGLIVGVLVIAAVLLTALNVPQHQSGMRPGWPDRTSWFTFFFSYLCLYSSGLITSLLQTFLGKPDSQYPFSQPLNSAEWVDRLLHSAASGPLEEVVMVVLLVWLLRLSGLHWMWVYMAAVVLRVPFHLYYGWEAGLGFILWPILIISLYRATRRIWPIILSHTISNLANAAGVLLEDQSWNIVPLLLIAGGIIAAIWAYIKYRNIHRTSLSAPLPRSTAL